jgi:hypothetical protein
MRRMPFDDDFIKAAGDHIRALPATILAKLAVRYYEDIILSVPVQTGTLRADIKITIGTPDTADTPEQDYSLPDVPDWKELRDRLQDSTLRVYVTTNKHYADEVEERHGVFKVAFIDLVKYAKSIGLKLK